MAARRGDFEGALGRLLALNVFQIGIGGVLTQHRRGRRRDDLAALEVIDEGQQRSGRHDIPAAGPNRLGAICLWTDQTEIVGIGFNGGEQHAGHRNERAV